MRDGQEHHFEAMSLRPLLEKRDWFFAVGAVMIDQGNLLALEVVPSALVLGDVLKEDVGGRPVGSEQREVPLKYRAVARVRAAIPHGDERILSTGAFSVRAKVM